MSPPRTVPDGGPSLSMGGQRPDEHAEVNVWQALRAQVHAVQAPFAGHHHRRRFDYRHPLRLQHEVPPRHQRVHATPVAYEAWGREGAPVVVCLGGVASTAMRFAFVAEALQERHRVICLDWLGRGHSGWLPHGSEYGFATYVEQLDQLMAHLGRPDVTLIGSSLGGSVAIEWASRHARAVRALVLNDVGPSIPGVRRQRRAESLDRFYVFRSPDELERRLGAAQKNDGRLSEDRRRFLAWQQTRWSEENQGRIYRLDPRAMQAYQREAQRCVDQWQSWAALPPQLPVLLLHGQLWDALLPATIDRMRQGRGAFTVAHVPEAGHAPSLCDPVQVQCLSQWLLQPHALPADFTLP